MMQIILTWINTHTPLTYFTQSLWRDEAFSILVAEKPLLEIIPKLSFEPPVYYTLLHFWVRLFGNSEIAARSLSLLAFIIATIIVIEWADRLFKNNFLAWYLPILFFTNPMLLYYAFEVRTYGWYTLFSVIAILSYLEKRFRLLAVFSILGFYTHTYFIFIPFSQAIHFLWFHKNQLKKPAKIFTNPFLINLAIFFVGILPWLVKIAWELPRLKQSWYFPVDLQLIKSVLGNLYTGYEGTPWYGWKYTAILSAILLSASIFAYLRAKNSRVTSYLLMAAYLPLIVVIGISFVKPLFVNRYLIQSTVSLIFLLSISISLIKHRLIRYLLAAGLMLFTLSVNFWFPDKHPKIPIRNTVMTVNSLLKPNDLIFASSPLVLFETLYYANDRSKVYLFNPYNSPFPWYVGDAVFSEKYLTRSLPEYPMRAFFINENGSYNIRYSLSINK